MIVLVGRMAERTSEDDLFETHPGLLTKVPSSARRNLEWLARPRRREEVLARIGERGLDGLLRSGRLRDVSDEPLARIDDLEGLMLVSAGTLHEGGSLEWPVLSASDETYVGGWQLHPNAVALMYESLPGEDVPATLRRVARAEFADDLDEFADLTWVNLDEVLAERTAWLAPSRKPTRKERRASKRR